MADALTIANAIRLAKGCARDAALLTQQGSRNAAYLAEQALEQVVRAIATSEGLHIERADAHQLDKVVRRFPDDQIEKKMIESLTWLEAYATTFRYTLPSGRLPTSPDATKLASAVEAIDALIDRVASAFGVDIDHESSPAKHAGPLRRKG
jgi:HEPN domain-containing protein